MLKETSAALLCVRDRVHVKVEEPRVTFSIYTWF